MTLINRLWDYDRDITAFLGWYRFFRQRASHLCPEYPYITKLGKENRRSRAPGRLPAGGTSVPSLPWASGVFNWDSRASDARLVARGGGAEARESVTAADASFSCLPRCQPAGGYGARGGRGEYRGIGGPRAVFGGSHLPARSKERVGEDLCGTECHLASILAESFQGTCTSKTSFGWSDNWQR